MTHSKPQNEQRSLPILPYNRKWPVLNRLGQKQGYSNVPTTANLSHKTETMPQVSANAIIWWYTYFQQPLPDLHDKWLIQTASSSSFYLNHPWGASKTLQWPTINQILLTNSAKAWVKLPAMWRNWTIQCPFSPFEARDKKRSDLVAPTKNKNNDQ